MPICSYDVGTLFLIELANESFSGSVKGTVDPSSTSLSIIQRRRLYDCDEKMIRDFVLSSAVVRVTGRVEKIQAYLEHKEESRHNPQGIGKFGLLNEGDIAGLPSYMALRHSGDAAFDKKGVTTEWMSP
jgi:hypothetical protein